MNIRLTELKRWVSMSQNPKLRLVNTPHGHMIEKRNSLTGNFPVIVLESKEKVGIKYTKKPASMAQVAQSFFQSN